MAGVSRLGSFTDWDGAKAGSYTPNQAAAHGENSELYQQRCGIAKAVRAGHQDMSGGGRPKNRSLAFTHAPTGG